ncbi:MAG: hypothetical protein M1609_17685, partial [Firmicutes bacterium]|nr:hypothetical protein [Bacillota bacterium]
YFTRDRTRRRGDVGHQQCFSYMDEESLNLVNLWTPREFFNAPADSATPDESPANAQPEGLIESEETLPCVHLMACPHCGWDTRVPVNHIFK